MKKAKHIFLLLFFLFGFTLPVKASNFFQFSKSEKKIWTSLFLLGAAYAGDNRIRTLVRKNRTGGTDDLSRVIGNFGRGEVVIPLTGILYLYGKEHKNERLVRASQNAIKNILISGGITTGMKWAVGRARPLEEKGARYFHPFSNKNSFPSGDTALAFAAASAYAWEYSREVKFLSYGLAVLVAYSRLSKDAHWTSDTLTSAFLSTEVARRIHHRKKFPLLSFTEKSISFTWTR